MTQESVRQRLIKYIEDKGTSLAFIGRKINLSKYVMSNFKIAKRDLWQESLEKLDQYLKNENY